MKKTTRILLILLLTLIIAVTAALARQAAPYRGKKKIFLKKAKFGKLLVYYVRVNPKIKGLAVVPAFCPGYSEIDKNYPVTSLRDMNRVYKPTLIVNGTFFDARNRGTVCNVALNGKLVCEGDRGTTLYLDKQNRPGLLFTSRLRGRNIDWSKYKWAIQSGPTLLYDGKIVLNPKVEGFRDPSLFRCARRTAVGIDSDDNIVIAVTKNGCTLNRMAHVMRKLKAVHAINLDGGSSSAFGYRGTYPVRPKRPLPNFLMVFENVEKSRVPDYPSIKLLLKARDRMLSKKYRRRGDKFKKKNLIGAALKYYVKACKVQPWSIENTLITARTLEYSGRRKLASKFYSKAARNALDSGMKEKAGEWAQTALKFDKNNDYAEEIIVTLEKHPEFSSAVKALNSGDCAGAFILTRDLLVRKGGNPRFYFLMARIFSRMNRNDLKAGAFHLAAREFEKQKDRTYEAYLCAKHAVESQPDNPVFRMTLARTAYKLGRKSAANYHRLLAKYLEKGRKDDFYNTIGKTGKGPGSD